MHRGLHWAMFAIIAGSSVAQAQTPVIDPNRIYNAASFAPTTQQPVAQGSMVSVFGTNFATGNAINDKVPFPISLGGVSLAFNNVLAPVSLVVHDPVNGDQI